MNLKELDEHMNEAQKILEMIESAKPEDTATLDEIDARVWCYKNGDRFSFISLQVLGLPKYTRSRDALKSIRPEGFTDELSIYIVKRGIVVESWFKKQITTPKFLPTEELAELHAIIQAIELERNNDR